MLITKFHKAAAYLLAILLMISLFCLPAFALPGESEGATGNETALTTTDDITGTTANDGIMGENDGITGENSDGMGGNGSGNLGDTDGDGVIEDNGDDSGIVEDMMPDGTTGGNATDNRNENDMRDPGEMLGDAVDDVKDAASGNWITAVICIVVVIALILIIVALMPKRRNR